MQGMDKVVQMGQETFCEVPFSVSYDLLLLNCPVLL